MELFTYSGIPLTEKNLKNKIQTTLRGVPPEQIMFAWSFPSSKLDAYKKLYEQVKDLATAGTFAWCRGNDKIFSYSVNSNGSCATKPPLIKCDESKYQTKEKCPTNSCYWAKTWAGEKTCQCIGYIGYKPDPTLLCK